jgi:ribosomal protein S18 acetylase RimI-like enzyme
MSAHDSEKPPNIRPLAFDEAPVLAETLARAFRDNPLNRGAIRGGSARRLRSNRYGMRATLAAALGHASILVPGRPELGGLIALPPNGWPLPPPPLLAQLEFWLGQGVGAVRRWGRAYRELATLHPVEPHWYLQLLGVAIDAQRQGVGAALLSTWLNEVDREGASAYLETDRRENLAFYRRGGFDVVGTDEILGVEIWRMRRPAWAGGL